MISKEYEVFGRSIGREFHRMKQHDVGGPLDALGTSATS